MFKNTFQSGFLSILYSIGSKPLQIWDKEVSTKLSCHTLYVGTHIEYNVNSNKADRTVLYKRSDTGYKDALCS